VVDAVAEDVAQEPKTAEVDFTAGKSKLLPPPDEFAGIDIIDTADDVDYESAAPKQVTAAMLNKWADEHGEEFPEFRFALHQTSINVGEPGSLFARVRIINLTDRSLINSVPVEVRDIVQRLFFAGSGNQRGNANRGGSRLRMEQSLTRLREVGYAYGVAGFIEPRLVMRKEDVKDPEKEAWVGSIALHDLTEFSRICEGDDQLAARRLERFSE
jgi:hypothetical protein